MTRHLSRKELIDEARRGGCTYSDHLAVCSECREAVELLSHFDFAGSVALPHAPRGAVEQAAEIMQESGMSKQIRRMVAHVSFDSWTAPLAIGLRGHQASCDRRLHFQAGDVTLDLRGERQTAGWKFVAQIDGLASPPENVPIRADNKTVFPDKGGLYQWSAPQPPKQIVVLTDDAIIETQKLLWKKPKSTQR